MNHYKFAYDGKWNDIIEIMRKRLQKKSLYQNGFSTLWSKTNKSNNNSRRRIYPMSVSRSQRIFKSRMLRIYLSSICALLICCIFYYLCFTPTVDQEIQQQFNEERDETEIIQNIREIQQQFNDQLDETKVILNIRDVLDEREPLDGYDMVIVYWNTFFGSIADKEEICNITDHRVTGQVIYNQRIKEGPRQYAKHANGFIWHGPGTGGNLGRDKQEGDVYIYHTMESPQHSHGLSSDDFMHQFDLLMTYHHDADIWVPYVHEQFMRDLVNPIEISWEEKNQNEADIAWIGSNCGATNGRQDYLRELFKYIPAHSYGNCLKTKGKSWPRNQHISKMAKQYKFYVVMENSNCRDYVTEKMWWAMTAATVPLVFSVDGIPNYERILPPHSYINAADFDSAKDLAEYLIAVGNNETAYNEYLWYRFNAMESEEKKKAEWLKITNRFHKGCDESGLHQENKDGKSMLCQIANKVFDVRRDATVNGIIQAPVEADHSCLKAGIMREYIDRSKH